MDFKETTLHCSVKTICQSCGKVVAPQESNPADTQFFLPFSTLCTCNRANLLPAPRVSQAIQYSQDVFVRQDFELVEALGSGTLADAYRVKSKSLNKEFVIKILDARLAENPRTAKRYRLAAAAALNLSHANLAHVVESGINEDGASYVVSEYIDGEDLGSVLKNEGFLDPSEVTEMGVQILEALEHAHEQNVMHRGVKPSNIYLVERKNGTFKVKLSDIGIARAWPNVGRETRFDLLDGSEYGDPRYMSPEQLSAHTFAPTADIYSLGCVLYEAVSGKTPFTSGSRTKIAIKQLTEEVRPLNDRFKDLDIPADLEAVIMKSLAKEPKDRYQTAREMLDDLQKVGKPNGPNAAKKNKLGNPLTKGFLPKLLRITKGNSMLFLGMVGTVIAAEQLVAYAGSFQIPETTSAKMLETLTTAFNTPNPGFHYPINSYSNELNLDLHKAAFAGFDLSYVRLRKCNLKDAQLRGANLSHAYMNDVDLSGADLRDADLSHAELRNVNLKNSQLLGATLPDDLSENITFR
jgi:serine/threonine protein kinase